MNDRSPAMRWGIRLLVAVILSIYARFAIVEPALDWDASDLAINYSAATLLRTGGNIYDSAALRQVHEARIGPPGVLYQGLFLTYINPPTTALFFWPLALLTFPLAQVIFAIVNNGLYLLAIGLIIRELKAPPMVGLICLSVGTLALFYPVRQSFGLGQMNGVLTGLLALALIATLRQRDALAGALIVLAAAFKISPIVLLLFFAAQQRWRAWLGAAIAGVFGLALMIIAVGWSALAHFVSDVLPVVGRGSAAFPNQSLLGAIYRFSVPSSATTLMTAMDDYPGARSIWLALSAVILLVTIWLMARARLSARGQIAIAFGTWIVVGVLISSIAWEHYALWLIVPLSALIVDWFKTRWSRGALFWPIVLAMVLAISLPIPYQAALYASLGPIGSSLSAGGMMLLLIMGWWRMHWLQA